MRDPWISTGKANRIMDLGICDRTFREKFKDSIRWKFTPGGQYRWSREDVETVKRMGDEPDRMAS